MNWKSVSTNGPPHAAGRIAVIMMAALLLVTAGWPTSAQAQPNVATYFTSHSYLIWPLFPQPAAPTVTANWYCHTWVRTSAPWNQAFMVTPAGQPALWSAYGQDRARVGFPPPWVGPVPAPVLNRRNTFFPWRRANVGTWAVPMPAGGFNSWTATSNIPDASALANSRVWVMPTFLPWYPLFGIHQTWGRALANNTLSVSSEAYAFSWVHTAARGFVGPRFRFFWGPRLAVTSAWVQNRQPPPRPRRVRDPIDFVVLGTAPEDTINHDYLLSIEVEIPTEDEFAPAGDDSFRWDNNIVEISARNLRFEILMNQDYVDSNWGGLRLIVEDGLVTESVVEGGFLGTLMPLVNEPVPFAFSLDTLIVFTADLEATGLWTEGATAEILLEGSGPDDPGGTNMGDGIADTPQRQGTTLGDPFPNPFNPSVTIRFTLAEPGTVELRVFDVDGRLVRTLVDGYLTAAPEGHTVVWDGADEAGRPVGSGIYFTQLVSGDTNLTKKLVLVR